MAHCFSVSAPLHVKHPGWVSRVGGGGGLGGGGVLLLLVAIECFLVPLFACHEPSGFHTHPTQAGDAEHMPTISPYHHIGDLLYFLLNTF